MAFDKRSWAILAVSVLAAGGCTASAEMEDPAEDVVATPSELLAQLQVADHEITLRELAGGHVLLTESYNVDLTQRRSDFIAGFDPKRRSFSELYAELGAAAHEPLADEKLARLVALDARFATRNAARADSLSRVGVTRSALSIGESYQDFNTDPAFADDFDWFVGTVCHEVPSNPAEICEVGHVGGGLSEHGVSSTASGAIFNESTDPNDQATFKIGPSPCGSGSCTPTLLQKLVVTGRGVLKTKLWLSNPNTSDDWHFAAAGSHWGWAVNVDE